jgi:hypothetical protein
MDIRFRHHYFQKIFTFLFEKKIKNFYDIPIIINNYNRLTTLKNLVEDLRKRGYKNIIILDNYSTHPELHNYYNQLKSERIVKLYLFNKNYGSKSLWKSGIFYKYMFSNFCYTDSDLFIHQDCPDDFMKKFKEILEEHKKCYKVGFSLVIDDLPDHYNQKVNVIKWESQFYENEIEKGLYLAPIDTTFALYRPFSRRGNRDGSDFMIRLGKPYSCFHMPWYANSNNLDKEELFYKNSLIKKTHWSSK